VAKKSDDIISTRLRLPAGLHRMVAASAKRNNRSINSEILWGLAHYLGDEAATSVARMAAEQRRQMHNVLRALIADPAKAAKAIENFDKGVEGEGS
jgi:Arc-like DNA binding domain